MHSFMERQASWRRRTEPFVLTAARVAVGVIMTVHGCGKAQDMSAWTGTLEGMGVPAPEAFAYLSMAAELLGGIGLVVGLLTPIAAFGIACNMVVAIALVHWPHGLLAKNNGFEFPLVLLASAVYFIIRGAGPISLDAVAYEVRKKPWEPEMHKPKPSTQDRDELAAHG